MNKIDEILAFWFEGMTDETLIDRRARPVRQWFVKDDAFDQKIREAFGPDLAKAARGGYESWEGSARGMLALIILFDQFSRNMHRGTPKMFETDPLALRLTLDAIAARRDRELELIERIFLAMPLMHAESLEAQTMSVGYFRELVGESKIKNIRNTPYYEYTLGFAERHHAIVARFGRFPHRNTILGRVTTPGEREFLLQKGSSF